MSETSKLYDMASLAEASYVYFNKLNGDFSTNAVKDALQHPQFEGRFTADQAADFVTQWEVISHQPNTGSGFSATLFKNKTSGEYVYAVRGTEGLSWDLLSADVGDIVTDGLALKQVVDMYNDWSRINTPAGQHYQAAYLDLQVLATELLLAERLAIPGGIAGPYERSLREPGNVVIDDPLGLVYAVNFGDSAVVFNDERAEGAGVLSGTVPLTITGHSLGGHLAVAFTRLFPETGAEAVTINGAGYPTGLLAGLGGNAESNIDNLFASLGGGYEFDSSRIQNLFGSAAPEMVTMNNPLGLMQQGEHDEVYIESWSASNVVGHGAVQMTDALAVYDLFIRIDQRFQTVTSGDLLAALNPLFEVAANDKMGTFETLVNCLGELFVAEYVLITEAQWGDRDILYERIQKIRDVLPAQGLQVTTLTELTPEAMTALAQTGLAYRYALTHLNPFVITGDAALYTAHNSNGALDLYNPTTGEGALSEQYLTDRATMLYWQMQVGLTDAQATDSNPYTANGAPDALLQDRASSLYLTLGDPAGGFEERQRVLFGGEGADTLVGGNRDDHLYGGVGNDTFASGNGNDYLEGGSGNDILDGGTGDDTLIGGAGNDTYFFTSGDGHDTLVESRAADGLLDGTIRINDGTQTFTVGGLFFAVDGATSTWSDVNGLTLVHGATWQLQIPGGGSIDLGAELMSGDYGIVLADNVATEPTSTDRDIYGDRAPIDADSNTADTQFGYDSLGNVITDPSRVVTRDDTLYDSAGNDHIISGDGNDTVYVRRGGNDVIDLGAGDDDLFTTPGLSGNLTINGGAGRDYLGAGSGQDIVVGGADADGLYGSGENDLIYGDEQGSAADFITQGATQQGTGLQGEWIDAHDGNDQIFTGSGNDLIAGGAGDDLIVSGSGNDYIRGDWDSWSPSDWRNWTVTESMTSDGQNDSYTYDIANIYTESDAGVGNDTIYAGAGDDVVNGERGNDTLYLEAGNDKAWGGEGDDTILGGVGNDLINGDNGLDTVAESLHGDDFLDGGDGNDELYGVGGSDTIFGGAGDDLLSGDSDDQQLAGADYLNGEAGNDTLYGGGGKDILLGGLGDDQLYGETSATPEAQQDDDFLDGGDGNDILVGGGGADVLFGGAGADSLYGDAGDTPASKQGDDYLDGGAGNDQLLGAGGADILFGGDGDDVLFGDGDNIPIGLHGNDYIDGGAGYDQLVGGVGDDRMSGGEDDDLLWGGAGNDILSGDGGNDQLAGDVGDDTLGGGAGSDALYGQDGNDTLSGGADDDQLAGGLGNDILSGDDGIDYLWGEEGDDTLDGGLGDDYLDGGEGNDLLNGGAGSDNLYGGNGLDTLSGGDGADYLEGEGDDDVLTGDAGNDTLLGGDGNDTLNGGDDNDQLAGEGGDDTLHGDAGIDYLWGDEGADTLYGGADDDELYGGIGNDILSGDGGNDILYGGDGDDVLSGGDGDDLLFAGPGNDSVSGGAGRDVYVYERGDGRLGIIDEGSNTLSFGAGIGAGDISLGLGSLLIRTGVDGDEVHIENFNPDDPFGQVAIDRFEFADGTAFTYDQLLARGFDISGGVGDDHLTGTGLQDRIFGGAGDDVLDGGAGDDALHGGDGNDTYVFGRASGQVVVEDTAADAATSLADRVRFVDGITPDELNVVAVDQDLHIGVNGSLGSLILKNWLQDDPANRIERFDFDVALSWDEAGIAAAIGDGNIAPTISGAVDLGSILEDGSLLITAAELLANASDSNGDSLAVVDLAADSGTLLDNGDGTWTYRPDADAHGPVSFSYSVTDGTVAVTTMAALEIAAVNDAPISGSMANLGSMLEDGSLPITAAQLLANASDSDGDTLSVVDLAADSGSLIDNGDGTWNYRPDTNANGPVNFSYLVSDGSESAPAAAVLEVTAVNDAPILSAPLADRSAEQDSVFTYRIPAGSFTDIDAGDSLHYDATQEDGSALPTWLSFDAATGTFVGTPASDDTGVSNIRVTAVDGGGLSAADVFSLEIKEASSINVIIGTEGNDTLVGTDGADLIDGRGGIDVMAGGSGDDIYYVDGYAETTIVPGYGGGNPGRGHSFWEHGKGHGRSKSNRNEGVGNGTELPPPGHDVNLNDGPGTSPGDPGQNRQLPGQSVTSYVTDTVIEDFNGGHDRVYSAITCKLAENVEELTLLGSENMDGTGNGLDNRIVGNTGRNQLVGGLGADVLLGGEGNDTYLFSTGDGDDTVLNDDITGVDRILFGADVAQTSVALFRSGDHLEIGYGLTDRVTVDNFFSGLETQVDSVQLAGGSLLSAADIEAIIQEMSAYAVQEGIALNSLDSVRQNDSLMTLVAGSWHAA